MHAVLVTFTSAARWEEIREQYRQFAQMLGTGGIPGVLSKTWITRDSTIGGFYFVRDEESGDRLLSEVLEPAARGNPAFSNMRVERFGVDEEFSRITHGIAVASAVA